MDLVGLSRSQALTTLAVAVATVTVLYLLRLRRMRRKVAYLPLWEEVLRSARTSQLFARLKRWGSWLLSVALVGLVTAALADPRPPAGERTLYVLVIDASLSMQATDLTPSRLEAARARAHELVEGLPDGDVALVVGLGGRPRAGQITSDAAELHRAIDAVLPTETASDAGQALALALDAAHDERRVRFVLLSDGALVLPDATQRRIRESGAELFAPDLPSAPAPANYAIGALAARPHPLDPSRAEVLLEVVSHAPEPAELEVVLTTEGRSVEVVRLALAPGERVRRFFTDVSGLDRTLEARLEVLSGPADALPADDVAFSRIARRTRVRVGVVSADNAYLEAALLLDEALEVTDLSPGVAIAPGRFDVVIFDGTLPAEPYAGPAIYLHPDPRVGGAGPLPLDDEPEADRPRFDVLDGDHPLLRWVALRHVNVARALRLVPRAGDRVVAGDEGVPLLLSGERDVAGALVPFVALAFDVRESDLPLRIAWPVLLLDAIRLLAPASASEPAFARAGEPFEEAVGATDARLVLAGTDAPRPVAVREGRARLEIERAGVHRLEAAGEELLVAVSPAAGPESALTPVHAPEVDGAALPVLELPPRRGARLPWEWLALGVLVLLLVEALTYHRRWTV